MNEQIEFVRGTTVLVYHDFCDKNDEASRYVISKNRFAFQLRMLRFLGCEVLKMSKFVQEDPVERSKRHPFGQHRVIITIDDGYENVRQIAHPKLKQYGFSAATYLVSARMGTQNLWDRSGEGLHGRQLMSWRTARELANAGMEFGAHTQTHVPLVDLPDAVVEAEVAGSREKIAQELSVPITTFSYPHGQYDERSKAVVDSLGFQGVFTMNQGNNGVNTPNHLLRRIEICGTESVGYFVWKMWTGIAQARRLIGDKQYWRKASLSIAQRSGI